MAVAQRDSAGVDLSGGGNQQEEEGEQLIRRGIKIAKQTVRIAAKAAKKGKTCAGSIATEFGNAKTRTDRWLQTR